MFGKMSVGVRRIATGPKMRSNIAATTNVYGRRSASRTIHIDYTCPSEVYLRRFHSVALPYYLAVAIRFSRPILATRQSQLKR